MSKGSVCSAGSYPLAQHCHRTAWLGTCLALRVVLAVIEVFRNKVDHKGRKRQVSCEDTPCTVKGPGAVKLISSED